jgi:hypothetical protein
MLKTTYTLRLSQLLKITPDLKKYMWSKLKPKKPNITTKVIPKLSVAIMIETHSKVDTLAIEVDNIWQLYKYKLGRALLRMSIRWRSKCKHHNKKPLKNIRFSQTKSSPIPPQNGILEYNQTFRNHQKFEDSNTCHTICNHI